MLLSIFSLSTFAVGLFWRTLRFLERQEYWTLRLRLALVYEHILIPYILILLVQTLQLCQNLPHAILQRHVVFWQLFASMLVCGAATYTIWRLCESRSYRRLRWKAWTGPSRTGIPSAFARYIGDKTDWITLESSLGVVESHPVEKFVKLASPFRAGIASDPTDLLKARGRLDDENGFFWNPKKHDKPFAYQPTSDHSVSLLWGEFSGFRIRCSRGIISVPCALLSSNPRLSRGVNGKPISLAFAILARNKGAEPASLICNLEKKGSFRMFEESSLFWPRPAKTLRGHYHEEMAYSFSLLGAAFVTAATELALLLADLPAALLEDWLNGCMEHQDLGLNRQAAEQGASPHDLARLYRGHYAVMLVSLSLHQRGLRLRPEMLVYDAICVAEAAERSTWASAPWALERKKQELEQCGSAVTALVKAII